MKSGRSNIIKTGKKVIEIELEAIKSLKRYIDRNFVKAVDILYNCKARIVVTGMGKSGIIARKIAATLSSTGTPAFFLDPAEGSHGDLGMVMRNDVILALSKTGETEEINRLLPYFKRIGLKIIAITSGSDSTLSKNSDVVLSIGNIKEACPFNLAPTSSSTAQLVLGDALSIALLKLKNFSQSDFALLHPAGFIGKQLQKVSDLMHTGDELPFVFEDTMMRDILNTIISKKLGVAIVINRKRELKGIIVDGDMKRILMKSENIMQQKARDIMTRDPKTIDKEALVVTALKMMEGKITSLIVIDNKNKNIPCGLIHIHDILKAGYV